MLIFNHFLKKTSEKIKSSKKSCHLCGKKYWPSVMKNHMLSKHSIKETDGLVKSEVSEDGFVCDFSECGLKFDNKCQLNCHLRESHLLKECFIQLSDCLTKKINNDVIIESNDKQSNHSYGSFQFEDNNIDISSEEEWTPMAESILEKSFSSAKLSHQKVNEESVEESKQKLENEIKNDSIDKQSQHSYDSHQFEDNNISNEDEPTLKKESVPEKTCSQTKLNDQTGDEEDVEESKPKTRSRKTKGLLLTI